VVPRKGDLHFTDLIVAVFGLSMSAQEMQMRRRLFTFACFTFLNFAADAAILLHKVETPPGPRHLLSYTCPVPAAEIARFVRQQQRRFRAQLAAGMPGSSTLLPPLDEEGSWPVTLPPDASVDLCSLSWAAANAYLIASSILVLWMHAYTLRMLRGTAGSGDVDGIEGLVGAAGRVVVLDPGALTPDYLEQEQRRPFVPFTGLPRKLDR